MRARTRRLGIVGIAAVLLLAAAGLAFIALQQSANLFYTPTKLAERGGPEPGLAAKIGGLVETGSVTYISGTRIRFRVIDDAHFIDVEYDGVTPGLFAEGAGVIAEGTFNAEGWFIATLLLAKHDENYVPRELKGLESPTT